MNSTPRDRVVALAVALALHATVLLTFGYTFLSWPPKDADDPRIPEDESEILLVNEYINLGDMLTEQSPADAPESPSAGEAISDANDFVNSGEEATPAPVVTAKRESPKKAVKKPVPEKTGPTKAELEEKERARREQAARDKIKNQMNFGGNGKGEGVSGTDEGTGVSGTMDGQIGHNLAGRTILSWGKNRSTKSGKINIAVTVNAKGEVISASYAGGSGSAAGDKELRSRTIAAARATRFSALPDGETKNQKGTLTWNFK